MVTVRIGCAGWGYNDWVGHFYPNTLVKGDWLTYYSERFDTVEVNTTFYRIPPASMVEGWMQKVRGMDFQFHMKVPQDFTHKEPFLSDNDTLHRFEEVCLQPVHDAGLLGTAVLQLSPYFKRTDKEGEPTDNARRLEDALEEADTSNFRYVVEFRHRSWANPEAGNHHEEALEILSRHGAGVVITDGPGSFKGNDIVGDNSYVRFHGRNYDIWFRERKWEAEKPPDDTRLNRYDYLYTDDELRLWVDWVDSHKEKVEQVTVIFNNHPNAGAAKNSNMLKSELGMDTTSFGEGNGSYNTQKKLF